MAANCFPSRRAVKTMQMDGRSSHRASADCVHAACKCMKHEAGPTDLNPVYRRAEHAAPCSTMDFCSWEPRTRDACQRPPQTHIFSSIHMSLSSNIHQLKVRLWWASDSHKTWMWKHVLLRITCQYGRFPS